MKSRLIPVIATALAVAFGMLYVADATNAPSPAQALAFKDLDPTTKPPVANLDLTVSTGRVPFTTRADGSGSADDVGVTSYRFSWGDGAITGPEPESTATHRYERPGRYRVRLTVMDNEGQVSRASKVVVVRRHSAHLPKNKPPVARLSVKRGAGGWAGTYQFSGAASTDDRGIRGYNFIFGDGTRTQLQPAGTVRHVYSKPGRYVVRLIVVDSSGRRDVVRRTLRVPVHRAQRLAAQELAVSPVTVSFTFDDTFAEQAAALDVLQSRGLNATVYVNSPRIGTSGYFSKDQLLGYQSAGMEIAGHTLQHLDLATLSAADATTQICNDRSNLLALGFRATSFAYPFGSNNATAKSVVASCGYNSARGVGNLASPGYGCSGCPVANTIPPADKWEIYTNQSIQTDTTLAMMQNYVTQAENSPSGGWVPLVFHHICTGCADNAITLSQFTQFADWMKTRPSTTQVRTVDQVMGGSLQPAPGGSTPPPPPPSGTASVTINGQTRALDGTNIYRAANTLIRYTPAYGSRTGTNAYGTEVSVVNGVITKIEDGIGSMVIPANGYVLSAHGTARTWLKSVAAVGRTVTASDDAPPPTSESPSPTLTTPTSEPPTTTAPPTSEPPSTTAPPVSDTPTITTAPPTTEPPTTTAPPTTSDSPSTTTTTAPPPPPTTTSAPPPPPTTTAPPPPATPTKVVIGAKTHTIDGINVKRGSDQLILYNKAGTRTGTNSFGVEVAVVGGKVTKVENGVGNMLVPTGGYVLSGHGTSRTWLLNNAKLGVAVTLQ